MEKKTTIGSFKPKNKFIQFIGGKGNVNFLANSATIKASELSGIYFEDITFKITIHEDGSVDLDELDTNHTTSTERLRLLEIIDEKTVGNFRGKTVVNELEFTSIEKIKDKNIILYLSVDYVKPIEKLGSVLDDDIEMSEAAMGNLDDLLNSLFDDLEYVESVPEIEYTTENPSGLDILETSQTMNDYMSSLEDSFIKMKEEKLRELTNKKIKIENEISKLNFQLSSNQRSLDDFTSELKLIESRLMDLKPALVSNEYYFCVSERLNEEISLDPATEELIRKTISKVRSINAENFMNLFKNGEFHIYIGKKVDQNIEIFNEYEYFDTDLAKELMNLDLSVEDNKFVYTGELTWGEIVNKMIKLGFSQDSDFDELCFPKQSLEGVVTEKTKISKF